MDIVTNVNVFVDQNTSSKPEVKEPQKFQAVYHQPAGLEIECSVCLLRDAFNIGHLKAHDHVVGAEKKGSEPVVVSTKEVIAEKIRAANKVLTEGKFCSRLNFKNIQFKSEPAP